MARLSKAHIGLFAILAAGLIVAAAPAARAFTVDNSSNTNSDGSAKIADPDDRYKTQDKSGATKFDFGSGSGTFTIGPQRSFDNDFNTGTQRMFSPLGRPGEH